MSEEILKIENHRVVRSADRYYVLDSEGGASGKYGWENIKAVCDSEKEAVAKFIDEVRLWGEKLIKLGEVVDEVIDGKFKRSCLRRGNSYLAKCRRLRRERPDLFKKYADVF